MKEFKFYEYIADIDKIKIYGDELHNYFEKYGINIETIDFDDKQNVVLYIGQLPKLDEKKLEKEILNKFEHLNDIEIRKTKIVLIFDSKLIELC